MVESSLHPWRAFKPPHLVDRAFYENFLYRPDRREFRPNLVPKLLEGLRVLAWEDGVTGEETMSDRVKANCGFALWRLWSSGAQSIRPVRGLLSFGRHGKQFPSNNIDKKLFKHRDQSVAGKNSRYFV